MGGDETQLLLEPIPNGSFIIRGYRKKGTLDFDGLCLVEPRGENEYEICKWLTRPDAPRDYIPEVIKLVRLNLGFNVKITGTFEVKKIRFYRKYFNKYNIDIPVIKIFTKTYNNKVGLFYYVELKERANDSA